MKKSIPINLEQNRKKITQYLKLLKKHYPDAHCALTFQTPLQILVATILSAQCTDVRVNKVTPVLFKKYKTCADFANTPRNELEQAIRSTGFFRSKAKSIQESCEILVKKFEGEIPKTMAELITLPGVARKTANVVLHNAYSIVEGITVDTHVRRLSQRLGLTKQNDPKKIEIELMKIVPQTEWANISYLLIDHGRAICKAIKPKCEDCFLNKLCPSAFSFDKKR